MAFRRPLLLLAPLAVLSLAACSDDASVPSAGGTAASSTVAGGTVAPTNVTVDGGTPAVPAAVDCALLKDTGNADGLIGLQLMPQLTSQEQIDLVKSGTVTFDPDKLLVYLDALRPLAGMNTALGDPAEAIEKYIASAQAAKALLAVEGPVPQEQLDAYVTLVGDPGAFIMGQGAIGAAIEEVCG